MKKKSMLLLILVFNILLLAIIVNGDYTGNECYNPTQDNEVITFNGTITYNSSLGFCINANNITNLTIDCDGNIFNGTDGVIDIVYMKTGYYILKNCYFIDDDGQHRVWFSESENEARITIDILNNRFNGSILIYQPYDNSIGNNASIKLTIRNNTYIESGELFGNFTNSIVENNLYSGGLGMASGVGNNIHVMSNITIQNNYFLNSVIGFYYSPFVDSVVRNNIQAVKSVSYFKDFYGDVDGTPTIFDDGVGNNWYGGFAFEFWNNSRFINNSFYNMSGAGYTLRESSFNEVADNEFYDVGRAIYLRDGSHYNNIHDNYIEAKDIVAYGSDGIQLRNGASYNNITDNIFNGTIMMLRTRQGVNTNNYIANNDFFFNDESLIDKFLTGSSIPQFRVFRLDSLHNSTFYRNTIHQSIYNVSVQNASIYVYSSSTGNIFKQNIIDSETNAIDESGSEWYCNGFEDGELIGAIDSCNWCNLSVGWTNINFNNQTTSLTDGNVYEYYNDWYRFSFDTTNYTDEVISFYKVEVTDSGDNLIYSKSDDIEYNVLINSPEFKYNNKNPFKVNVSLCYIGGVDNYSTEIDIVSSHIIPPNPYDLTLDLDNDGINDKVELCSWGFNCADIVQNLTRSGQTLLFNLSDDGVVYVDMLYPNGTCCTDTDIAGQDYYGGHLPIKNLVTGKIYGSVLLTGQVGSGGAMLKEEIDVYKYGFTEDCKADDILYFNISDTINPVCDSTSLKTINESQLPYSEEWNINCTDETLSVFNMSCDNGFINLNSFNDIEFYNFINTTIITTDTICNYNFCDGYGNCDNVVYMINVTLEDEEENNVTEVGGVLGTGKGTGISEYNLVEVIFIGFIFGLLCFFMYLGYSKRIAGIVMISGFMMMFVGIFIQQMGFDDFLNIIGITIGFMGFMVMATSFGIK